MNSKNAIKIIFIQKSYSVHFGPIRSILSSQVHFDSICSMLVLLGPICPNWSYSILFSPIWFTLVIFSPLWFYSVHISSIWSIMSTSVDIGPIRSTLILFGPYVHFGPNLSIGSYSVMFNSPCSHYVILCPTSFHLCPLRSIFMHLHIRKGYVWVENTYSNPNLLQKIQISNL